MPVLKFEWDDNNIDHVALHNVDQDEAEAVLDNNPLLIRGAGDKYLAYGQTDEGRYLLVVFARRSGNMIRVVTARDLTAAEKKQYRKRKK